MTLSSAGDLLAAGRPRDSLSVLDQLLAGADGNQVHYQRALVRWCHRRGADR